MEDISALKSSMAQGDMKALARCITIVENELEGHEELLASLDFKKNVPVIGITGPPGAGKSTLINSLLKSISAKKQRAGIIAIDPTSPFNFGSLLGDRLRMSEHFNSDNIFIRSLATRGSLGGISAKTIEVCDVMRNFNFDYILIETVGVGQSEVEIAGLADTTVLVLVPEAGDEVQTLKSGIMEIADVFVVNKADRDGADSFVKHLISLVQSKHANIPVLKTSASSDTGTDKLLEAIAGARKGKEKHALLLAEKAWRLIQQQRMKGVDKRQLQENLAQLSQNEGFNLYLFCKQYHGKP